MPISEVKVSPWRAFTVVYTMINSYNVLLSLCVQCLGVLVTVAGFVVIFLVGSYNEPAFPHAIVGIILTTLMIQQFLSGIL